VNIFFSEECSENNLEYTREGTPITVNTNTSMAVSYPHLIQCCPRSLPTLLYFFVFIYPKTLSGYRNIGTSFTTTTLPYLSCAKSNPYFTL